ncbi:MAG: hypothetical protein R2789_19335 [Microthrixaceae bacterium]
MSRRQAIGYRALAGAIVLMLSLAACSSGSGDTSGDGSSSDDPDVIGRPCFL